MKTKESIKPQVLHGQVGGSELFQRDDSVESPGRKVEFVLEDAEAPEAGAQGRPGDHLPVGSVIVRPGDGVPVHPVQLEGGGVHGQTEGGAKSLTEENFSPTVTLSLAFLAVALILRRLYSIF